MSVIGWQANRGRERGEEGELCSMWQTHASTRTKEIIPVSFCVLADMRKCVSTFSQNELFKTHTQKTNVERPCGVEGRSYKLMYGRECLETDVTEVRSCATSPMGGSQLLTLVWLHEGLWTPFFLIFLFWKYSFFIVKHFFCLSGCCVRYLFFRRILKSDTETERFENSLGVYINDLSSGGKLDRRIRKDTSPS